MDIEGVDRKQRVALDETIKVDISNRITTRTTIGISEYSLHVASKADRWSCKSMEHSDLILRR